ncbi:MAG: NAD(P)H-dependent glycerol-3-phosphate dehydrogenase [candidate division WOR-3 bacterium]
MIQKVAFIGAGRWAIALALKLNEHGIRTSLWDNNPETLKRLSSLRRHPDLPETALIPKEIELASCPAAALSQAELVVFAVPSDSLASAAHENAPFITRTAKAVVSVTKGIDPVTLSRMSVVLRQILPRHPVVVLAGPGIPFNVAQGDPTSLVAASDDESSAELVRDTFSFSNLRVYSSNDVAGVELGAAFKNVIALAAGIADGLGLGINAKAALLTRGLAEITRLGLACNCNPLTFSGLSGMGDLIVTAFSPHSRNHQLGLLIGEGLSPAEAQTRLRGVAEGVTTCASGLNLARKMSVEMPITEEVFRIVHEGTNPKESIDRLLRRKLRKELWQ